MQIGNAMARKGVELLEKLLEFGTCICLALGMKNLASVKASAAEREAGDPRTPLSLCRFFRRPKRKTKNAASGKNQNKLDPLRNRM